ncbi:nucleoside triphosphate pyrophosphohydrolase [Eubacterium multiforme]|uniref:Tetrapyrrole methylase family protein/MazG family protein n=1 Tax=Eubacterium multiforme TaxID=83339 RepID=A0ABT9UVB1_9FIRM|nr:nucleoside triphosphate pyrophosphohydrolase [Eubacterium multiforme]MDQ0150248.1 tetrapyrrole methylase family protein/MazG family protein [Eubacterium multiforme]
MIKIVGLGPGDRDALTIGTLRLLEESENIYFRTENYPIVDFIKERNIKFKTYDHFYNTGKNFDEVYKNIAEDIIKVHKETGEVVYAVPGHPLVAEKSVSNLIDICDREKINYEILPAVSFIDIIIDKLKIDPTEGFKIIDAFDINNQILDKRIGTIITEVYNPFIASEVKLKLLEYYDDETKIIYIKSPGVKDLESIREIPLYELDMQEDIDCLTFVYIPKDLNNKKDINDLIELIDLLRSEEGCPWDREQTHESIRNELVEESYEVKDAIEKNDEEALVEELGDVLLHVIFHSSIGREDGYFDFNDVVRGVYKKMVDRHPHIFKNNKVSDSEEVLQSWDELKKEEKGFETVTDELNGVAKALPALIRAHKIQNKARKVGFDWDNVKDASKKVLEELDEVLEVYNSGNKERITEEVGDLLFSCVNVSRFLDVDEEEALNKTTDKFIRRFSYIEEQAIKNGKDLKTMTLEEMDKFWNQAKKQENN